MAYFPDFSHSEVKETDCKCMYCQRDCEVTETVYTGDENSYKGFELWCYCNYCETDTFKRLEAI